MNAEKIVVSLCYFSIFFLGFFFPLIVWLVASDDWVKGQAKAAMISHIIPLLVVPFTILAFVFDMYALSLGNLPILLLIMLVLGFFLSFFIMIWNVYKGFKVLF